MNRFTSVWDFDLLWSKSKLYSSKANEESKDGPMYPFWSALVLELLARTTLSKIHPVLLADPRDGSNTLYVFGYAKPGVQPRSITAKTVFDRCMVVVPGFTKKELNTCLILAEKRNEELHTGSAPFIDFSNEKWLSDYYKVCKVLLNFIGFELDDLFGIDAAGAAEEMIREIDISVKKDVLTRISVFQKNFDALAKAEQSIKIKIGIERATERLVANAKVASCVSCSSKGLISGKTATVSEDKLDGGEIVYEKSILPTSFLCFSCGLKLNNHQELAIAGLGGLFVEKVVYNPAEYHGFDSQDEDFSDYYDYGND